MHQVDLPLVINYRVPLSHSLNRHYSIFHLLHLLRFSVLYKAHTFLYCQLIDVMHNLSKYYIIVNSHIDNNIQSCLHNKNITNED